MIYTRTTVTLLLTSLGLTAAAHFAAGPPFVFSAPALGIAVVAAARCISGLLFGTGSADRPSSGRRP